MTRKPTYEELEKKIIELEQAILIHKKNKLLETKKRESIDTLIGGVAHDFNNFLYIILGNTEVMLEDTPKYTSANFHLEEIKKATLQATDVIRQLLNFIQKDEKELQSIDIVIVVKAAIKLLQQNLPNTIKIEDRIPDVGIPILGDPNQISHIIRCLCKNASQAMEGTGGRVCVNLENVILNEETADSYTDLSAGRHVKISVSDSGPGVATEIHDRIFEPYFTTKRSGDASGMGLTIVQGIVKNHDGAVLVDNEPGKGATFNVFFPVA